MGWYTSGASREQLIAQLSDSVHKREVVLHHRDTVEEMVNFVFTSSGRWEAQVGFHDDLVFGLALAVEGAEHYPAVASVGERYQAEMLRRQADETRDKITGY